MADTRGDFGWANALAIRAAGVAPEWVQQVASRTAEGFPGYAEAPTADNPSLGVSVSGAMVTGLNCRLRENPAITRTARISATVWESDASTYDLFVAGDTFNAPADTYATVEDMFDVLLAALQADSRFETSSISGSGSSAELIIRNTEEGGDPGVSFAPDGTDVFVVSADAASADLRFYGIDRGTNGNPYWGATQNGELTLGDDGIQGLLLDTSQTSRLYCFADAEGEATDGAEVIPTVVILYGPSTSLVSEV